MDNFPEIFASLRWRLLLAIPCFAVFVKLVLLAPDEGSLANLFPLLIGMGCLVAGGVILCPPLARLVAEPAGWLFYSTRPVSHGLPSYQPFEDLCAAGKHEEAIACLETLVGKHPDEVRAQVEMLRIAMLILKNPERTEQIYLRGMQTLRLRESKNEITKQYLALKTQANP